MLEPRQDGRPPQAPTVAAPRAVRRPTRGVPSRRGPDRPPGEGPPRPRARRPRVRRRRRGAPRRPAAPARADRRRAPGRRPRRRRRAPRRGRPSPPTRTRRPPRRWPPGSTRTRPRSRARRAAAAPAPISLIVGGRAASTPDVAERATGRPGRRAPGDAAASDGPRPPLRDAADPDAGDVALGFEFARRGRRRAPRASACRRRWPATPASPWPSITNQLAHERELADAPGARRRARHVRLDRRPRAADAAHGAARLPRADPRRPGPRSGGRARLPRAEPVDRRLDGATSSATCWSCRGWSRGRSTSRSGRSRSPRPAPRSPSSLLPIAIDHGIAPDDRPAAADAGRDGRPTARRADPDEPRRRTP